MSDSYKDEEAYELSSAEEFRDLDDIEYDVDEDEQLLPAIVETGHAYEDVMPTPRLNTDFLDGLRGLAAVFVWVQHFMPSFYPWGDHERGFGQDGIYAFVTLPYIRLFTGNGGNPAVPIFFVLSGYVLSIGPLRKLKDEKVKECRKGLLGAVIRRPLRLYLPPLVISFTQAMLLHVPGPLVLPTPFCKPQEGGILAEIAFWWEKLEFFSIFREHGSHLFAYPYNVAMWTIPIELKGSILVYSMLFILSLGLQGTDRRAPLMMAVAMFCTAAIMLQRFWAWSMACFLFGMMLAIVDTWPVGAKISNAISFPSRAFRQALPPRISEWTEKVSTPLTALRESWSSLRSRRLCPSWLSKRLPRRQPKDQTKSSWWALFCFWCGWYLLSEPSHAGNIAYSATTFGWVWLTKMIPQEYGESRYYRYWESWGSLLAVYAVLRIGWVQWFFSTRPLRFLGYVSFMLYLIHLPWFRIFPDRFTNLIGNPGDPHNEGTFWDKTLTIPHVGPLCLTPRVLVGLIVCLSSTLLLAWGATVAIDQPSVRLGKWITTKLGLEKPRPRISKDESVALPT